MQNSRSLYQQGQELASELFGNPIGEFNETYLPPEDDLDKTLTTWFYGYLFKENSQLPVNVKVLCVITMCTAIGQYQMLKHWIPAAKKAGCTRLEVQEAIITMIVYAGWPAAQGALKVLAENWPQQ